MLEGCIQNPNQPNHFSVRPFNGSCWLTESKSNSWHGVQGTFHLVSYGFGPSVAVQQPGSFRPQPVCLEVFFFSDKPLFSQLKNTSPCSSLPLVSAVSRDSFIITQLIHHLFAEVFLTRSFFSYIDQVFFLFPLYSQLFHDLPFVSVGWGFMRQSRGCTCLVCHCISGVWHRA